jgi:hypothetical protein
MSTRKHILVVSLIVLFVIIATPIGLLRVYAIHTCIPRGPWSPSLPEDMGVVPDLIRRARLDYIVAPIDGVHRLLVCQAVYRPEDNDIDLVFTAWGDPNHLVIYRYNWHQDAWYCKICIPKQA